MALTVVAAHEKEEPGLCGIEGKRGGLAFINET
jgi:hypothetical protein